MTAKEFLKQAFKLEQRIKLKQSQIQQLRDMQDSVGGTLSLGKVQSSQRIDRMGDLTAAIMDLVDDYTGELTKLLRLKYDIKKVIECVDREDYRMVLEMRYVDLMKWEDIAEAMNYHVTYVYKLHGKALLSIEVYVPSVI